MCLHIIPRHYYFLVNCNSTASLHNWKKKQARAVTGTASLQLSCPLAWIMMFTRYTVRKWTHEVNTIKPIKTTKKRDTFSKYYGLPELKLFVMGSVNSFINMLARLKRWVDSCDSCETAGWVSLKWVYGFSKAQMIKGDSKLCTWLTCSIQINWLWQLQTKEAPNILLE